MPGWICGSSTDRDRPDRQLTSGGSSSPPSGSPASRRWRYLIYSLYLDLGANPVETVTNTTGIWTLRLIVATLAITPLRWLTGINQLINYRRLVGLFAFFYGSLHFTIYVYDFFIGVSSSTSSGLVGGPACSVPTSPPASPRSC